MGGWGGGGWGVDMRKKHGWGEESTTMEYVLYYQRGETLWYWFDGPILIHGRKHSVRIHAY
jgi:hypothetical protein